MGFVIESGVLKKYIEEPKVTVVEIPEGVTSIDEDACADCETVSSVVFPSTFKDERSLGFRSSLVNLEQLKEFLVDEKNPYFTSVEGILYNKDMTELLCCPADYYPLKLVIPNGVKYIHSDAFSGCNNLREVIIPDTMKSSVMKSLARQFDEIEHYDLKVGFDPQDSNEAKEKLQALLDDACAEWMAISDQAMAFSCDGELDSAEVMCGDLLQMSSYFTIHDPETKEPLKNNLNK